jgi:hypothetical protein
MEMKRVWPAHLAATFVKQHGWPPEWFNRCRG